MDDNKKQKRVINTSVVLSFVVSIFAVFSLAMFGIVSNQDTNVSYAFDPEHADTVELHQLETGGSGVFSYVGETKGFYAPYYYATAVNDPVFCVEKHRDPAVGTTHNKSDAISDKGLLYLLNNSFANGQRKTGMTGDKADRFESWITQVAIWMYMRSSDSSSPNYISDEDVAKITGATSLRYINNTDPDAEPVVLNGDIYNTYIKPLVDKANEAKTAQTDYSIGLSRENEDIGMTEDKKFYITSLITPVANPSSMLKSYDLVLSGIEGAEAVDQNGKVIENLTGLSGNTKFYVRVPENKVTDKVQTAEIYIKGHFKTLEGFYYLAGANDQKIVSINEVEETHDNSIKVEFVKTPDTGMNTAQTIYFIGLIVLLCGVGIVYANAKPVQVK